MQTIFDENSYKNVRHLSKTGKSTLISSLSLLKADDLCLLFRLIFLFNRQTGLSPVKNNGIVSVPAQENRLFSREFNISIARFHYQIRSRHNDCCRQVSAVVAEL